MQTRANALTTDSVKSVTVFDCFMYFNEDVLLAARLMELGDVVDYFVIVESTVTHQGNPRELEFPKVRHSLPVREEQIIYVTVLDLPSEWDSWAPIERHQRNAIMRGLSGARGEDIVLISDVDEIPRAAVVRSLCSSLEEPVILSMAMINYKVNLFASRPWKRGMRACRFRDLVEPDALRYRKDLEIIPDAGWHISYLGDTETIVRKQMAYSHVEYSGPRWVSERHIRRSLRLGVRFLGAWVFRVAADDECLPSLPRDQFPHLYFPQRTVIQRLVARPYALISSYRDRMPNWITDIFIPLGLLGAIIFHVSLNLRAKVLRNPDAAQRLRDMGYGGF